MKKRLAVSIVLAAAFVAVATWAFGQRVKVPPKGEIVSEGKVLPQVEVFREGQQVPRRKQRRVTTGEFLEPAYEPFLIDDVDPSRRVPVPQTESRDQPRPPKVRAVRALERGPVGRYAVAASEELMVLVDTTTGSTWVLCPAASGCPADAVWLPIRRIDDKDEAALWKAHQEELNKKATKGAERKRR